ncbi:MAG: hypothetical protein AAFY21_01275, partial [Cyanobacteria bacterium J06641_2]
ILKKSVPMERLYEMELQILRKSKDLGSDGFEWKDWRYSKNNNGVGRLAAKTLRTPGFHHFKTKIRSFAFDYSGEYYDIEDFENIFPIDERLGDWVSLVKGKPAERVKGYFLPYKTPEQRNAEDAENAHQQQLADEEAKRKREERRKQYQLNAESYTPQDISLTGNSFSLLDLIAKTSLETFHSNGTPGDNNKPSFLLAYDLFGCEDWAKRNGITLTDSAERLFADYGIRVYPNDPGEINGKMNAARGKSPIGGDDRVRKKVEYLLGYRRSSNKLKNLALKTSKKREEEKSEAVGANNSDSNTTPDDNKNDNSKFPPVVVEGVVNNSGRGFGKNETFKKEANAWLLSTALKNFEPNAYRKIKKDTFINKKTNQRVHRITCLDPKVSEYIENWTNQKPPFDASDGNGIVAFGDLNLFRGILIYEKKIYLTDSDDTAFKFGLFVPTDGIENGVSDTLLKSVSLLRSAITDAKEKGFKIKLIIEQNEERVRLIKFLKNQGLANYCFVKNVENKKGVERGAVHWLHKLEQRIKPDITINQEFLDPLSKIARKNGCSKPRVAFVKSPTGTGKTTMTILWGKSKKEKGFNPKILAIYSLTKVVDSICKKLNLVNYQDGVAGKYSSCEQALKDPSFDGLGICLPSLKNEGYANFDPELWANHKSSVLLVLDEIEATLSALADSSIINNREEIYENLKTTIQAVLKNKKGRILVSDANLSQSTIDFIKSCLPEGTETVTIENLYRHDGNRKALIYESKDHLLSDLNDNKDKLNFIATDCRRILGKNAITSSRAIEHMLDNNCMRTDGYTSHTTDNPNYSIIKNIETLDKQRKINKSPVITPAAAQSISIENTEFNAVYGFFKGICDGETIHQMLERDRSDAVRKMYVAGCRSGYHTSWYAASEDTLEREEKYRTRLHTKALEDAAGGSKAAKQAVSNISDEPEPLKKWRQQKAAYHYWFGRNLKDNVIADMLDRGYEVEIVEPPENEEIKQDIASLVDKMQTYCEETWEADKRAIAKQHKEVKRMLENGEEDKLIKLDQQQDRTAAQHTLVECYKIAKWSKSLTSDGFDMNPQHVELFVHHRKQVENGVNVWAKLRGEGDIAYDLTCANDVVKSLFTKRLKRELRTSTAVRDLLIDVINVPEISEKIQNNGGIISQALEWVSYINHEILMPEARKIYSLLGIKLDERPNRAAANLRKILSACGYETKKAGRATKADCNGYRPWLYELQQPEPEILQIWVSWIKYQLAHQDFQNWTGEMKEAYSKLLALEAEIAKSPEQNEPTAIAQGELAMVT